jgi:tetratricopeptide (TPR) repeat protein
MLGLLTDTFKAHLQLALAFFYCGQISEARQQITQARSFSTDVLQLAPESRQALERLSELIDAKASAAPTDRGPGSQPTRPLPSNLPELPVPPPAAVDKADLQIEGLKAKLLGLEKRGAIACIIGLRYFAVRQPDEALPWFRIWEAEGYPEPADPDVDWTSCALGFEYVVRTIAAADEVEKTFQRLLQRSPECSQLATELGTWLLLEGRLEEAETQLKRGLELDPTDTQAMCCLAEIEEKRGDRRAAIELYGEAVQVRPDPRLYNKLGLLFQDEGHTAGAVSHFKRAALLGMSDAYWNLAQIEETRGYATGVKLCLERYLEAEPRDIEGWLWLFKTLLSDGSFEGAAQAATNALILGWTNPKYVLAWLLAENLPTNEQSQVMSKEDLAVCQQALRSELFDSNARQKIMEVAQKGPLTRIKRMLLAVLYEADEQVDSALAQLDSILEQFPQDYSANMLKYQFLLRAGAVQVANSFVQTVLVNLEPPHNYARLLVRAFCNPPEESGH